MRLFECKIRYEKQITDTNDKDCGKLKKVTETYLVRAENCTDAEARLNKEVVPYIKGEWVIPQEKEVQVAELINEKDDMCSLWYAVKIKLMIVDEGSGREKAVQSLVMVRAEGLKDALSRTEGAFKDTMCDYEIVSIAKSPVLDYFG